jgi:hypothetical protein
MQEECVMTDTSGQAPSTAGHEEPQRFRAPFTLRSPEGRETFMEHLAVWDAPAFAIIVAIGVPLMGWIADSYFAHYGVRMSIATVWFALTGIYWYIEVREILAQIRKYGVLQRDESDAQRSSMQSLYWGALVAFLCWLIPVIVYWATYLVGDRPINAIPYYGVVEWGIIVHTVLTGRYSIKAIYALISEFQEALATQRRREMEQPPR